MDQKKHFVRERMRGSLSMAELCRRFGISRQCGYKWLRRVADGDGLEDLSRRPHRSPQAISKEVEDLLVEVKKEFPHWGPKKLVEVLRQRHPTIRIPAPSTAGDALKRHGLVGTEKRVRNLALIKPSSLTEPWAPNSVWCLDFKGHFRMKNGTYCYPLTATDAFSRFLLVCKGFTSTHLEPSKRALERAFREYGLPRIVRSDNGAPFFASNGGLGLSRLGVWFIQLGIEHQRIELGKPQQNGQHERMHRTLALEATRPPQYSLAAQQRVFDSFRTRFNHLRPHEGIEMATPSSRYRLPSLLSYPTKLPKPDYPSWNEIRRVGINGTVRWNGRVLFLSHALDGNDVAFEPLDEHRWSVRFFRTELAVFDESTFELAA